MQSVCITVYIPSMAEFVICLAISSMVALVGGGTAATWWSTGVGEL